MTIRQIAEHVLTSSEGTVTLTLDQLRGVYDFLHSRAGDSSPLLTVIRLEKIVLCQFSEYGKFRILIEDRERNISQKDLSFADPVEFIDTIGKETSFFLFLIEELRANKSLIVVLSVGFGAFFILGPDNRAITDLFALISQIVAIFAAVFVVFSAANQRHSSKEMHLFATGHLAEYHRTDRHLASLAIAAIFLAIFGTIAVNSLPSLQMSLSMGQHLFSFDASRLLIILLAVVMFVLVLILFLSIPQYYFERKKHHLFADLTRELLDSKHDERRASDSKIVSFPPSST